MLQWPASYLAAWLATGCVSYVFITLRRILIGKFRSGGGANLYHWPSLERQDTHKERGGVPSQPLCAAQDASFLVQTMSRDVRQHPHRRCPGAILQIATSILKQLQHFSVITFKLGFFFTVRKKTQFDLLCHLLMGNMTVATDPEGCGFNSVLRLRELLIFSGSPKTYTWCNWQVFKWVSMLLYCFFYHYFVFIFVYISETDFLWYAPDDPSDSDWNEK